ncbi:MULTISPECIES: cation-translocating P-type ATPase [unclassified Cyanobium]|uniref:heavy metal translocating P-type ATPase n=1 Tax=unclassified Cyanobium TaxID=2627006 RepID=UPI0020CD6771|nr:MULTISPECIES: heavy metal translocating P-type ATPase [unclassified Cyanobium]
MSATPLAAASEPLLLDVEGMKCGGCVRAVEQRLLQTKGVRQASVNLLTRTAWVDLEPRADGPDGVTEDPLPALLGSLEGLGFQARLRSQALEPASQRQRRQADQWWRHWRQLLMALLLLLVSGLGHLAEAGQLPWRGPWQLLGSPWFHALVATLALAVPGRPILIRGVRSALAGVPGMDSLVGLGVASAYLSSLVGWLWPASGWPCYFNEPVMLLGFVLTGRFLEERARYRTGRAIEELSALQPDHALLLLGEGPPRQVRVGGLRPGDRLRLLPGDRVPVDAVVREGRSSVDASSLTGEPLPRSVAPGSELAAGLLNLDGSLVLEVQRSGAESAIARIVHMVERAQARKAPIQGLADRIAGRFTLVVLVLAVATLLFWWLWGSQHWPEVLLTVAAAGHGAHGHGDVASPTTPFSLGLQLAIAVLVVACPCALGLATPTAITVGSGLAARSGLLFRGGDAIETASRLEAVLFDKTGTLTVGLPLVTAVRVIGAAAGSPAEAAQAERLVQLAASLEQHSRHPLAHAVLQQAQCLGLPLLSVAEALTHPGEGVQGQVEGSGLVQVGRLAWLAHTGVAVDPGLEALQQDLEADGASLLAVASDGRLLGLLAVEDQPRADAAATLALLRQQGLRLGLLSGDRRASVEGLGRRLGLRPEELAWELRPEQKLERLLLAHRQGAVAMVGDGVNDAPALAAADLGIAVGTGTQIAQESAALVVMGEGLDGIVRALEIARRTMAKVRQNLAWAFGYNLIVLPIAAGVLLPGFGLRLSPELAALLMAFSSITVVGNALLLQISLKERP